VIVRQDRILPVLSDFFNSHLFGPDRAELLAAQIPANAAEQARHNASEENALHGPLRRIDASQDGLIKDLEALHDPARATPLTPAAKDAMRDRIQHRFAQLQANKRGTVQKDLARLARHTAATTTPP